MKISTEKNLNSFEFWGGASDFAEKLTDEEIETIEEKLEEIYPDGIDETELNDMFWFYRESLCDWIDTTEDEVWDRD